MQADLLPYQMMWVWAFGLFFVSKWASWMSLSESLRSGQGRKRLFFLLGYPGMDPHAFLVPPAQKPMLREWAEAFFKVLSGTALLWLVARYTYPANPMVCAWVGMTGFVLGVHCGLFHLLALIWRFAGFGARPIMHSPLLAESLSDFWSNRWNLAFHFLAFQFVFAPVKRRFGPRTALLATFFTSGLVHEMVITLPAQGGYGLPTVYFLLQGGGIALTQTRTGRKLRLRRGLRARVFTWCATILPVPLLFPPAFINNVLLPFFKDIGAI